MKKEFAKTDYLLLGETHFSQNIGKWVKYWAKDWQKLGYNQFLAEIGPISAEKLTELTDRSSIDEYKKFIKTYRKPLRRAVPIPVFDGQEDIAFLKELFQYGFTLHGIDQEFIFSFPYLWNELFMEQGEPEQVKTAKHNLEIFYKKAYKKIQTRGYNIFEDFMNNDTVLRYYKALGHLKPRAKEIKSAIETSLKIYSANMTNSFSHVKRVHYIRQQARKILDSNKKSPNKYIVKIGRYHAGKYRQYDAYDVGQLFHETAKMKGKTSLHIRFSRGYYQDINGDISDPKTLFESYYFRQHASKTQWTLIDLRAYAKGLATGEIVLPDAYTKQLILSDLDNFDLILIPPLDKAQSPLVEKTAEY